MKKISIIIPCYNEEGNILPLFDELFPVLDDLLKKGYKCECICVDDGSTDSTRKYLEFVQSKSDQCFVVKHDKNMGVGNAYHSGIMHSSGDYIITLSADREIPPIEVVKVIGELENGKHFVNTNREKRWGGGLKTKILWNIPSRTVNKMVSIIVRKSIQDVGSGLKGFKRTITEQINVGGSKYLYFPAYSSLITKEFSEIDVEFRPRVWGESSRKTLYLAKEVGIETPRLLWKSILKRGNRRNSL